jgi:hypothetical protein
LPKAQYITTVKNTAPNRVSGEQYARKARQARKARRGVEGYSRFGNADFKKAGRRQIAAGRGQREDCRFEI